MFHFIYIPDLAYSFPVFVPRISTKFTGNNMEVIRIPSRAFPWSVFMCCEEAFTFPLLAQMGFPQGDHEPAQRLWESTFQGCWGGGNLFLGVED